MTTLNGIIENVKREFTDIETGRKDYERASQGLEVIATEMSALEETLKACTGYDSINRPKGEIVTTIAKGDVEFTITSRTRTKRPKYKSGVEQMESYLEGMVSLMNEGRTIVGVAKHDDRLYVAADRLLETYAITVAGLMVPEVQHTIQYEAKKSLGNESVPEAIYLRDNHNPSALNKENAENYVRMILMKPGLQEFVTSYEAALTEDHPENAEVKTAVTQKISYASTKSTSAGPNWAYVVATMIGVPSKQKLPGELNIMASPELSIEQKEAILPDYQMIERTVYGQPTLFVAIQDVYNRIQNLKDEQTISAQRIKVAHTEIV